MTNLLSLKDDQLDLITGGSISGYRPAFNGGTHGRSFSLSNHYVAHLGATVTGRLFVSSHFSIFRGVNTKTGKRISSTRVSAKGADGSSTRAETTSNGSSQTHKVRVTSTSGSIFERICIDGDCRVIRSQ